MKVLYLTYPMAFHTPGGGEIQLLNYRSELVKKGMTVDLFDQWSPDFLSYDVVHFFSCIGGSEPICRFISQLGLPLVVSSSLWITEKTRHEYDVDQIKAQLSWANTILTNSEMESDKLSVVLEIDRCKFKSVFNGVASGFFWCKKTDIFPKHFKIDKPYVLNVGNIEPRKNQKLLIDAMKMLPDYQLVIAGHVRDNEYFKSCQIEQTPNVVFVGPLDQNSEILYSAYKNASAFALPSTLETPGIAALEAAACGLPIAITSEGSTKEYFSSSNAVFLDHRDPKSIARAIQKAIGFQRGSAYNNVISWNEAASKLVSLYQGLIEDNT